MGHQLGKQAANAVEKGQKKAAKAEKTPEQIIREVRLNLASGLFVPQDRFHVVLAEYDKMVKLAAAANEAADVLDQMTKTLVLAGEERERLLEQVDQLTVENNDLRAEAKSAAEILVPPPVFFVAEPKAHKAVEEIEQFPPAGYVGGQEADD